MDEADSNIKKGFKSAPFPHRSLVQTSAYTVFRRKAPPTIRTVKTRSEGVSWLLLDAVKRTNWDVTDKDTKTQFLLRSDKRTKLSLTV